MGWGAPFPPVADYASAAAVWGPVFKSDDSFHPDGSYSGGWNAFSGSWSEAAFAFSSADASPSVFASPSGYALAQFDLTFEVKPTDANQSFGLAMIDSDTGLVPVGMGALIVTGNAIGTVDDPTIIGLTPLPSGVWSRLRWRSTGCFHAFYGDNGHGGWFQLGDYSAWAKAATMRLCWYTSGAPASFRHLVVDVLTDPA